jgi:hypothetical protein
MTAKWSLKDTLARAERRRSPWLIVAIPVGFVCMGGMFLVFGDLTYHALFLFTPDKPFFCTPSHVASIVLFLASASFSVPCGFMIANLLLWIVPPIRIALARADARAGQSFGAANRQLLRLTFVLAAVLLPICAIALGSRVCLSETHFYYQSHALSPLRAYDLSQLVELRPWCTASTRGGWNFGLNVVTADGTSFDLAVAPWFASSSGRILAELRWVPSDVSQIEPGCPRGLRARVLSRD